eukprot:scaffold2429_cov149-Skeletonema_menzelii.AAC.7
MVVCREAAEVRHPARMSRPTPDDSVLTTYLEARTCKSFRATVTTVHGDKRKNRGKQDEPSWLQLGFSYYGTGHRKLRSPQKRRHLKIVSRCKFQVSESKRTQIKSPEEGMEHEDRSAQIRR